MYATVEFLEKLKSGARNEGSEIELYASFSSFKGHSLMAIKSDIIFVFFLISIYSLECIIYWIKRIIAINVCAINYSNLFVFVTKNFIKQCFR